MKKKTIIISSLSAIMLCIALVVGLTVALFTDQAPINISVRSGSVQVKAEITQAKLYSMDEELEGNKFTNGGTAFVNEDGAIKLDNVSAGDRVEFTIAVTNESTIDVMFSTLLKLVNQDENLLFNEMEYEVSAKVGASDFEQGTYGNDNAIRTSWAVLQTEESATVKVMLEVPEALDGAAVQGRTANLKCVMSAVQYTGDKRDMVATIGQNNYYMSLDSALAAAQNGDVIEIYNGDSSFTGSKTINKSVTLTSADGILRTMNDVQLTVGDGYSVEFSGLKFTGNSSVDITGASAFTMKNCTVEAAPERLFDEGTQSYLPRAAFLVSSSVRQTGTRLTLENNAFALAEGSEEGTAAVYLAGAVTNGSLIGGNTFGTVGNKTTEYGGYAVELQRVGVLSGAAIRVENNEFYGAKGIALQSSLPFKAFFGNNKMFTQEEKVLLATAGGASSAQLLDNGSTVNGKSLTLDNLSLAGLFKGINVTYDGNGRLTGGTVQVYGITEENFNAAYASPLANALTVLS